MCYVVMRNDIADDPGFHGLLPAGRHFDLETPYGYGGPLTDAPLSPVAQQIFMEELRTYCLEQRIVTQFLRYHPLLDNHGAVSPMTDTRYLRDTIYMDTASPELILANMDSKNRNMVRKAQRSGVTVPGSAHVGICAVSGAVPSDHGQAQRGGLLHLRHVLL